VALVIVPWSSRVPALWRDLVRVAEEAGSRWCFLVAPPHVALVDARGGATRRSLDVTFPAALAPESFACWRRLLDARAFDPGRLPRPAASGREHLIAPIERLLERAALYQHAVGVDLQRGVEHALAALTGDPSRSRLPASGPSFDEALTIVYRILFLLFAESRELVPRRHPIYQGAYSVTTFCREAVAQTDSASLWDGLAAVTRLARRGCAIDDLVVTAFNGRLFSRDSAPVLEGRSRHRDRRGDRVNEHAIREALVRLGTRPGRAGREEISYADLGVEELGAVYERVLDLDPATLGSGTSRPALRPTARRHSRRRKESGTFYTPRSLTEFVVRRTLAPLVDGRAPEGILALRVLDPAMGSGAFLVAACRFLAAAYEHALVEHGHLGEADLDEDRRAAIRRLVAERCLAGVDTNPVAVELARLSIWLTTLARGKPLGFLDHRLRVGNSLLGASPDDLHRIPGRRKGGVPRNLPLFDPEMLGNAIATVSRPLGELLARHDDSVADVRAKERLWTRVVDARSPIGRWRRACSLWCTQWLEAGSRESTPPSPQELRAAIDAVLGRDRTLRPGTLARMTEAADSAATHWNLFHWPLEFPDIFYGQDGQPLPNAGFDAVIGNPPWDMLRRDPRSVPARTGNSAGHHEGEEASREFTSRFIRHSGMYRHGARGHLNLYQPFLERALSLTRRGGRLGLVLPWGLASDDGAAGLRGWLVDCHGLDTIVGLDNARGLFPIHRAVRFLAAVIKKDGATQVVRARFGVQTADEIENLPGRDDPLDTAYPVRLTPRLLTATGGSRRRFPDGRRAGDLALADRLMQQFPALGSPDGWHARFGRELNVTDDSRFFSPVGLPIVEGKNLTPFQVDASHARHHIARRDAERVLGGERITRPRLAYRDVSGVGNRVSLVAAVVPAEVVTSHTLFCLRTPLPIEQHHFLAALMNSFVLNAVVRLFMGQHVTTSLVEDLPAPVWSGSQEHVRIAALSARMAGPGATAHVEAELQAAVSRLYGLDASAFARLFSGFPLVKPDLGQAVTSILRRPRVAL